MSKILFVNDIYSNSSHVFPQVKYKKIYFKIKIIDYGTYSTCTLFKLINFRILAKWADTETHTVVVIAKFAISYYFYLLISCNITVLQYSNVKQLTSLNLGQSQEKMTKATYIEHY